MCNSQGKAYDTGFFLLQTLAKVVSITETGNVVQHKEFESEPAAEGTIRINSPVGKSSQQNRINEVDVLAKPSG